MIGEKIRQLREDNQMLIREVAAQLETDTAMLSKMERGERPFKKEDVITLAKIFGQPKKQLLIHWLAERILKNIAEEDFGVESLKLALKLKENNNE